MRYMYAVTIEHNARRAGVNDDTGTLGSQQSVSHTKVARAPLL
jgi:hypothetical protein